jgi:hypothetical protein
MILVIKEKPQSERTLRMCHWEMLSAQGIEGTKYAQLPLVISGEVTESSEEYLHSPILDQLEASHKCKAKLTARLSRSIFATYTLH